MNHTTTGVHIGFWNPKETSQEVSKGGFPVAPQKGLTLKSVHNRNGQPNIIFNGSSDCKDPKWWGQFFSLSNVQQQSIPVGCVLPAYQPYPLVSHV